MEGRHVFIIVLMITTSFCGSNGYNILSIFPHFGKSHYWIFEPILKELAHRGHNVTVYSFFPPKENIENFNFVNLEGSEQVKSTDIFDFNDSEIFHAGPLNQVMLLKELSIEMCEQLLKHEIIQELSHPSVKYDVVLYEIFIHDCFLPLIGKIDAPRVALSSSNMLPWYYEDFGYIDNPNYNPIVFMNYAAKMSFSERLINSVYSTTIKIIWNWHIRPNLQAIAEKYIPTPVPKISEVIGETSLVLINSHFTVLGARPMGPNFIEIAGIHLGDSGNISQDLRNWIDTSEHGIIYFSMGSMLRGSTLPDSKRNAIMEVFKGLKERVLWKWEENEIPGKVDNVRIEKWLPQRAVLAHPKTKVFITHCGMLSSVEAVDGGVPTLCIPMFGDQPSNQRAMQMKGISVFMEYNDINKETFRKNLLTVLQPEYKQRALEVQRAFRDRPLSPLDTSIYWIEYVVRQNGSEHIKMPTRHLYWFQKFLLDVVLIYTLALFTIFYIIRKILSRISIKKLPSSKLETKKKKIK